MPSDNPLKKLKIVAKSPAIFSENPPYFGVLTITDDPLTVGPEISSKIVGYGQGFYATFSLEEVSMLMGVTFVFTDGEYNEITVILRYMPLASRILSCCDCMQTWKSKPLQKNLLNQQLLSRIPAVSQPPLRIVEPTSGGGGSEYLFPPPPMSLLATNRYSGGAGSLETRQRRLVADLDA
ncbi:hypothetical protein ACS0TY_020430 [Phlomoides rotata]